MCCWACYFNFDCYVGQYHWTLCQRISCRAKYCIHNSCWQIRTNPKTQLIPTELKRLMLTFFENSPENKSFPNSNKKSMDGKFTWHKKVTFCGSSSLKLMKSFHELNELSSLVNSRISYISFRNLRWSNLFVANHLDQGLPKHCRQRAYPNLKHCYPP